MTAVRFRRKHLFLALYLAGCFLFFEGFARLVLKRSSAIFAIGSRQGCCVWDLHQTAWRLHWIYRHFYIERQKFYKRDRYDSTLGWMPKPRMRQSLNLPGDYRGNKRLTTNALGFRGKVDYSPQKDPARTRIMMLGDSNTFGDEVGDEGAYPYFLQQLLPQTEILNFGVHAYGHDQMLILWKKYGLGYDPDIVVLGFVSEDLLRNQLSFRDFAKPKFELEDGRLTLTNTPVPSPEEVLRDEWWHPKIVDLLRMMAYRIRYLRDPSLPDRFDELSTAILDELVRSVRESGARPLFLYIPTPCFLLGPEADPKLLERAEKAFFAYCSRAGIACHSAQDELRRETTSWTEPLRTGGHWDARGNAALARALASYLVAEKWIGEATAAHVAAANAPPPPEPRAPRSRRRP